MTNHELNVKVAQALGYKDGFRKLPGNPHLREQVSSRYSPATDIAQAMELLERLPKGWCLDCVFDTASFSIIAMQPIIKGMAANKGDEVCGPYDQLPAAICRAWLAAKGVNDV